LSNVQSVADLTALVLLLVLTLYCRFYHYRAESGWGEVAGRAGDDLWFEVSAQRLDEHLKHNGTVDDFLRQLLERDVIRQHDRVTRDQRGHWNALWFQWHDDKLVWQRDYRPTWRSSKMANCLNILADLRLVEADDLNTKVSQS